MNRLVADMQTLENRRLLATQSMILTDDNQLLALDLDRPQDAVVYSVDVTGLNAGDRLIGIDYRPATGILYGVGQEGYLYIVNDRTGVVEQVGNQFAVPLDGDTFAVDFNPTVDRLRVISNSEQNLRVNPNTGGVVDTDTSTTGVDIDGSLDDGSTSPGDRVIVGAAYTNNFSGATSTTLFAIDSGLNSLYTVGTAADQGAEFFFDSEDRSAGSTQMSLTYTGGASTAELTRVGGDLLMIEDFSSASGTVDLGTRSITPGSGNGAFLVNFSTPVKDFSASVGDFGVDDDLITFTAYDGPDGTGNIVGTFSTTLFASGTNFTSVNPVVTSDNDAFDIQSVIFSGGDNDVSIIVDNLAFTAPVSQNSGQLFPVGTTGALDFGKNSDIDVLTYEGGNYIYGIFGGSSPSLFRVDPDTGEASRFSDVLGSFRAEDIAIAPFSQATVLFLTDNNRVIRVDPLRPTDQLSNVRLTGLAAGEDLLGIDVRPATGEVFALSTDDQLYEVNTNTGKLSPRGSPLTVPLNGSIVGFDFNPTVDRIRITTNLGQNLRVNPDTGEVADTDTATAGTQPDGLVVYDAADPSFGSTGELAPVGDAYTNSFAGTGSTLLYSIDGNLSNLVTIGSADGTVSPNSGTAFTVSFMGLGFEDDLGFDVLHGAGINKGYAVLQNGNRNAGLYNVDLKTGETIRIGSIGNGYAVKGAAAFLFPRDLTQFTT